jgi:hypothetical protein
VINRSTTRDTPISPLIFCKIAHMFGTHVAETILASVHVRAQQQAVHMDANDLIKIIEIILRTGGRPHMGNEPCGLALVAPL